MSSGAVFEEKGSSWWYLLFSPLVCAVAGGIEIALGDRPHVPALLLISGIMMVSHAVMILALKQHGGVTLTEEHLVTGREKIPISAIAGVYPAQQHRSSGRKSAVWARPEEYTWHHARTLGELTAVPRGRTAIGLITRDGTELRAWAKKHQHLREALTQRAGVATPQVYREIIDE